MPPNSNNASFAGTYMIINVFTGSGHWAQRSMNLRPNITSYPVYIEDGGGNGGESGFG